MCVKRAAGNDEAAAKGAFTTLLAMVGNAATRDDEKYRKIRLGNAAFASKVGRFDGAVRFLTLLGFSTEGGGGEDAALVLPLEQRSMALLNAGGAELNNALSNPFFGVL